MAAVILDLAVSHDSPEWATSTSRRPRKTWPRTGELHLGQVGWSVGETGILQAGQGMRRSMGEWEGVEEACSGNGTLKGFGKCGDLVGSWGCLRRHALNHASCDCHGDTPA